MMTVHEVSKLAGISVRALQHYDRIGLLSPARYSQAGYRLYDDASLEKLQQILLLRELEFSLKDIKAILEQPGYDKDQALDRQIELLLLKRSHIDDLLAFARELRKNGGTRMDFSAFDDTKIKEYAKQAKENWGGTKEYREFEKKSPKSAEEQRLLAGRMMDIFKEFGSIKDGAPDAQEAQLLVRKLQGFITEHYYTCSDQVLKELGKMYAAGGEFTDNIDSAGGKGTAAFASSAIAACRG